MRKKKLRLKKKYEDGWKERGKREGGREMRKEEREGRKIRKNSFWLLGKQQ